MRTKIRTLILTTILLLPSVKLSAQGYVINGRLHGSSKGYATLRLYHRDGNETLDSTTIDKSGRFTFRGPVKATLPALLTINGKRPYRLYISPESTIHIELKPGSKHPITIKGSPMTQAWHQLINSDKQEDKTVHSARLNNWVNNHPEHIFSPDLIASYLSHTWDYPTLARSLNTLQGEALNTYHYRHLREHLQHIRPLAQGNTAPDLRTTTPDGTTIQLHNLTRQHDYTLLTFWSAYDKTSRAHTPALTTLRKHYQADKLEILSISIDQDPNTWKQTIKDDNMTWQQGNEPQSWNSPALKTYNIKSIPTYILIDRHNKIHMTTDDIEEITNQLATLTHTTGYTIDGTIDGIDEGTITIDLLLKDGKKERQQSKINNGHFHFEGEVSHPCMATIHLPARSGDLSFFMNNEHITINSNINDIHNPSIEGSPTNDTFLQLSDRCNNQKNPMQCLMNHAMEHPESIYTPFIISSYLAPYLNEEDLKNLVTSLTGDATNMYQYTLLQEHIQTKDRTNPTGEKIRDAILQNEHGKDIRILEEASKHDYTLITIWAPWEQKSLNTIKQLRQLYNNQDKNHFHIISISLDDNPAQWHNTIKAQGMNWTNLSDHKRWNSGIVKLYDIDHIPQTILIDRHGTIITKNQPIDTITDIIKTKKTTNRTKNQTK